MAGKIVADQIEHSTAGSLDTQYVVNGSAKAWVNVNGATAAARDSLNVSSVDDVATGRFRANYSSSFSAATYCPSISGNGRSGNGTIYATADVLTGSFVLDYAWNSSSATYTLFDPDTGACSMFGDLA